MILVFEIIMELEWLMRYYLYNLFWDVDEEVFEMRSGCGENMFIFFSKYGFVISGINDEYFDWKNDSFKIENFIKGLFK